MMILAIVTFIAVFSSIAFAKEPPEWSDKYIVNGILYLSNGEIEEPFKAWYDAANGRSRIDYYDGTVSTYQMSQESEYGKLYRIIPKTTFEESNKRTCYQFNAQRQGDDEEETSDNDKDTNVDDSKSDSSTDQESSSIIESSGDDGTGETDATTTEKYEDTNENEIGARKTRANKNENKSDNARIKPQTVLPDCTNFKYIGVEKLLGWTCSKFVLEEVNDEETSAHTVWVRYVSRRPIPMRYEMHKSHATRGINYDRYHIDYESFNSYPSEYNFDNYFNIDIECEDYSTIGNDDLFNPINAYINTWDSEKNEEDDEEHSAFLKKHGIKYGTKNEHKHRKHIFKQNLRFIQSKNRANLGFTMAVNQFTDRSRDELRALRGYKASGKHNGGKPFPYKLNQEMIDDLPESLDWRLHGAVTSVKHQTDVCGACWAFGAVGAIEGALFLHNGKKELVRLSEQALIDCSWGYENDGCDGGWDFQAFEWVKKNRGIPTEESYGSYKAQEGLCHVKHSDVVLKAPITGWVNVTSGDSNAMKFALLKNGPISAAIHAPDSLLYYSNGVFSYSKCLSERDQLNHVVLVVGYGIMDGQQYWLIKNSWGENWGMGGYFMLSARKNHCGLTTVPTYVIF